MALPRVVSCKEGIRGTVKIGLDADSFFLFRLVYLGDRPEAEPGFWPRAAYQGLAVDEGLRAVLEEASEATAAELDALDRLARREYSRLELELALSRKGHASVAIEAALDRLEAEGLLSDARFAEAWLRKRLRTHPEGEILLRAGLANKGLDRSLVDESLKAFRDDIAEGMERAARRIFALERRRLGHRAKVEKGLQAGASASGKTMPWRHGDLMDTVYRRLRSLGYAHRDIVPLLKEISGGNVEIDETDDST
jgi:regulatory protein